MFHIKDDFKDGEPISKVGAKWFNQVARFLNYLVGDGIVVNKPDTPSENDPPTIIMPELPTGGDSGDAPSPSDDTPLQVGINNAAPGTSLEYSRSDHCHALAPPSAATADTSLVIAGEGTVAANSTTWTGGKTTGAKVTICTRVFYSDTAATPVLYGFYRTLQFDEYGRLVSISAETRYVIDQPVALNLS